MKQITMYVIRHIPTGHCIPEPRGRYRGSSHDEPVDIEQRRPRLFEKRTSAVIALSFWLKGKHFAHYDNNGELIEMNIKPITTRHRHEMEVVEIVLTTP